MPFFPEQQVLPFVDEFKWISFDSNLVASKGPQIAEKYGYEWVGSGGQKIVFAVPNPEFADKVITYQFGQEYSRDVQMASFYAHAILGMVFPGFFPKVHAVFSAQKFTGSVIQKVNVHRESDFDLKMRQKEKLSEKFTAISNKIVKLGLPFALDTYFTNLAVDEAGQMVYLDSVKVYPKSLTKKQIQKIMVRVKRISDDPQRLRKIEKNLLRINALGTSTTSTTVAT